MGTRGFLVSLLLIVVAVPIPAWAECGWLLWENVRITYRAPTGWVSDEKWTIIRTYDDAAACRADHKKSLAEDSAWFALSGSRRTRIDNGVFGEFMDEDGKVFRKEMKRALCVPGSIDPRGPKAE